MNYSFNSNIAKEFGVENAVMIENLYFWIRKNKANDKHFHNGSYWTYNSVKAFEYLFPFWSKRQIERILKNLETQGAIITGNYNKSSYDRTKWYALTQTVLSIYANGEMEIPNEVNGNTESVEPIPYINTDSKNTDIKTDNIYSQVIEYLNLKANKNYKSTTPKNQQLIRARQREGFTLEDFKTVIDNKVSDSKRGKFDEKYLRPQTLFGTKFEGYLNQGGGKKSGGSRKSLDEQLREEGIGFFGDADL